MMFTLISTLAIFLPNQQIVKIRKTKDDSDSEAD